MPSRVLLALLATAVSAGLSAQSLVTSVDGVARPATDIAKVSTAAAMRLDARAAARELRLVVPTDSERAKLAQLNSRGEVSGKLAGRPQFIGFGREVLAAQGEVRLESLAWARIDGGAQVARLDIASGGALGLRAALKLASAPPGLVFRFAAPGAAFALDSVAAAEIARATARFGEYWSPVIEGERIIVELEIPDASALAGAKLVIPRVSHLVVGPRTTAQEEAKILSDIGDSGSCNVNVKCVQPQDTALANQSAATGKLVFSVASGATARCTGTLINTSPASFSPFLYSANHCFESAYEAATLNVWWFFDATACGSSVPGSYVVQTGGAFLIARSQDWDWALLLLNTAPPAGTFFSGWNGAFLGSGANVEIYHHPSGDLKKWSQGTTTGTSPVNFGTAAGGAGQFTSVVWSDGTTEGGSSGGGLVTFTGSNYQLRGGLLGGSALCSNPNGTDYFSQFGVALRNTREYITPTSQVSGLVSVVEYYHAGLDHYFITAIGAEIQALDSGAVPGWERTGFRFLAYTSAGADRSPVCRYYVTPEVGNSHFYSASPSECAAVASQFGNAWVLETSTAFYIALPNPSTGACPSDMRPIYRYFRASELNHRFTPEVTVANELSATGGWAAEGYGPGPLFPIMCSPYGS